MALEGTSPRRVDFSCGAVELAALLLGHHLIVIHGRTRVGGMIVETEAYVGPDDLASHSRGGRRTPRNASMYLPAGHGYVYLSYGVHWCFNVVARGSGEAVLVRALRPLEGLDTMRRRRGGVADRLLCAGPGRLCQALAIDRRFDGADLSVDPRLLIVQGEPLSARPIATTRIGVESAGEWARRPWRFLHPQGRGWWSRGVGESWSRGRRTDMLPGHVAGQP